MGEAVIKDHRRALQLVKKWKAILGISTDWKILVCLYDSREDCPKGKKNLAAWIENESPYLRSYLSINMWQDETKQDLESVITHEILHIVLVRIQIALVDRLAEMPYFNRDLIEGTVTQLENAFKKVRGK